MNMNATRARLACAVLATSLLLAGCAGGSSGDGARVASSARPVAGANHAALRGDPEVWNLRAGLNVAALSCRKKGIERDYKRVLDRHRILLKASYAEAQRRGGRNFDRDQTRLYNRFAQQRSAAKFCQEAAGVAQEAGRMDSYELAPRARTLLARLDRARR